MYKLKYCILWQFFIYFQASPKSRQQFFFASTALQLVKKQSDLQLLSGYSQCVITPALVPLCFPAITVARFQTKYSNDNNNKGNWDLLWLQRPLRLLLNTFILSFPQRTFSYCVLCHIFAMFCWIAQKFQIKLLHTTQTQLSRGNRGNRGSKGNRNPSASRIQSGLER